MSIRYNGWNNNLTPSEGIGGNPLLVNKPSDFPAPSSTEAPVSVEENFKGFLSGNKLYGNTVDDCIDEIVCFINLSVGDKDRLLKEATETYHEMLDKKNELQKQLDYWKARCEAAEECVFEEDAKRDYPDQYKTWQALKQKKLNSEQEDERSVARNDDSSTSDEKQKAITNSSPSADPKEIKIFNKD